MNLFIWPDVSRDRTRQNYKRLYTLGYQNVTVDRINGMVALTGFYSKKMDRYFTGTIKSDLNNEVTVRRGSAVLNV